MNWEEGEGRVGRGVRGGEEGDGEGKEEGEGMGQKEGKYEQNA